MGKIDDKCSLCRCELEKGIYWAEYRLRVCRDCDAIVADNYRDYSKSNRGRLRTKADLYRRLGIK